jgi:hypothetical protein
VLLHNHCALRRAPGITDLLPESLAVFRISVLRILRRFFCARNFTCNTKVGLVGTYG